MSISEVYECKNRAMYSYFNILYIRPFGLLKKIKIEGIMFSKIKDCQLPYPESQKRNKMVID